MALGQGVFGSVLVARPRAGGPSVAVKKFKGKQDVPSQLEEVYQLQSVSSPHVVPLLDVICGDHPGSLSLVFPLAKCSLAQKLCRDGLRGLQDICCIVSQVAQGSGGILFCSQLENLGGFAFGSFI